MRASLVVAAILGGLPASSLACSCMGTQSIGNAMTLADAVVVGKVVSHSEAAKPGRVTVPGKPSDDLAPGTLNSILKQAGLRRN